MNNFLQLLKSFGNSTSAEQKIAQLAKNFIELEKESNRRAAALKTNEKVLEKEQREKEHLQREYNKGVLMRFVYACRHSVIQLIGDLCNIIPFSMLWHAEIS